MFFSKTYSLEYSCQYIRVTESTQPVHLALQLNPKNTTLSLSLEQLKCQKCQLEKYFS